MGAVRAVRALVVRAWVLGGSLLVVASGGCGEEHRGVTGFCVDPAEPPESLDYREDEPLKVLVHLDACVRACEEAVDPRCDVEVDGMTVDIGGSVTIRQKQIEECGTQCQGLSESCDVPPLPAGSYEFSSGELAVTVEIPSQPEERYCDGTAR